MLRCICTLSSALVTAATAVAGRTAFSVLNDLTDGEANDGGDAEEDDDVPDVHIGLLYV